MRRMFSENQIKNIVNEGVQQGEIQAGKKLYSHYVVVEGDNLNFNIILVTTTAEQINSFEKFYNACSLLVSCRRLSNEDNGTSVLIWNIECYNNNIYIYGYDYSQNESFTKEDINSETGLSFTDSIKEL